MNATAPGLPSVKALSMKEFRQLGAFIHSELGIKMPDVKRGMVESRLRKRLIRLKLSSYKEYCSFLFSAKGMKEELPEFINVITTNKTDFFREAKQFTYLTEKVLPELSKSVRPGGTKKVSIWSTACSRGHEPYTLAMVVSEFAQRHPSVNFIFDIVSTDISTKVLKIAKKAVYPHEEISPVAMALRKKYLLKSKDKVKNFVRIVPQLRAMVKFYHLNLMDKTYPMIDQMDIIFCRNVMIYFERQTQTALLHRLCRHLKTGGYLFVGHSEVLQGTEFPLVSPEATIYRKTEH